jgi:hypothetical protein
VNDRDFEDLASLYLDGALPPDRAAEFDRALAEQPGLAARFVRLSRVHGGLRELESMGAGADHALPVRRRRPRPTMLPYAPLAVAAAVLLGLVLLLVLPEATHGPTVGRDGDPEAVLVVGRADDLRPGDRALRDRLVRLGFRVTPIKDSAVGLETTRGRSLLVLSESTISTEVGSRLADAPVPILNCEPNLNESLRMTTRSARAGEVFLRDKQRAIRIADPAHPIAAGLSGTVAVYSGREGFVTWGVPDEASARIVARCATREGEPSLFAYEAGRGAGGAPLPARRVSFFASANTDEADRLTDEGWALFEASVRWLAPAE